MNKLSKPWLIGSLLTAIVMLLVILPYIAAPFAAKSPMLKDQSQNCIGSGHYFGKGVNYTIEKAVMCDGKEYRVLRSKYEKDVEIWSDEKEIMDAQLGSTVRITKKGFDISQL